ncbi:unnamed protein product, partial [Mesorhabditis belari]|uniref:G-protein coupled receptors family 1 profile domain-containing protein n=1 Tax=Mesorhabditis belari TaxID=2138241 RepID=A0AAF3ESJ9_9BILA
MSSNDSSLITTTPTTWEPSGSMLESNWGEARIGVIVVLGLIFALLTTVGNLMVMVSFKIDRQLQTISNYFLFSLAVADITIGMISIPLYTYYTANRSWGMGYAMCQFWLCVDYLMSNASVLNLLLISFDRYFSVTRPLTYRPRRTTKKALTMIACTYIISLILWPPWIISWPYIEGEKLNLKKGTCAVLFLETNPYVTVGTAIAAFYLPVSIMIILYSRVYCETKKRQKEFSKLQAIQHRSIRRDLHTTPSSNSLVKSSTGGGAGGTGNQGTNSRKTTEWSIAGAAGKARRLNWIRACTGKSAQSSEDSSEVVAVVDDQTSVTSSFYQKRKGSAPHSTVVEDSTSIGTGSPRNGSRYRTRNAQTDRPQVDTYTVLIELKDEGTRPSVRLSSCDSGAYDEVSCTRNSSHRGRSKSEVEATLGENEKKLSAIKENSPAPTRNGKATLSTKTKEQEQRKSEKERKKNERKQESKAAKTLSAILFAFIVTWTPYNVIVCWEAFFPRTVPIFLYDLAYCLCYINSTINPLCYALCNARFRHTYMRILRCRFKQDRPNMNRNAFIRRN